MENLQRHEVEIGIISSKYPIGPKHDAGRAVCCFAKGLAALGHRVTVYTYNSSNRTQKYWETKNLKVVSIGVVATIPIKAGLIYEDSVAWNEGIWEELKHEDTMPILLVFDWFGFDAAAQHRSVYGTRLIGVVGALANGRGGFVPFTDGVKLADFKEKELEFLQSSDHLVTFNKCSNIEVMKLSDVPSSIVTLGVTPLTNIHNTPESGKVLIVGRISREKCIEVVLRAMVDLYWLELTLCGTGKDTDYGGYVSQKAKKLEVANRVVFTEGIPEYSKAEIVVCPSVYDTFSYQVYDAFNYGVPVIGHFMSYMDVLRSGDNSFSYQSLDELSKALQALHDSQGLRKRIALAAKADCLEYYTQQRSIERMDHFLSVVTEGAFKSA